MAAMWMFAILATSAAIHITEDKQPNLGGDFKVVNGKPETKKGQREWNKWSKPTPKPTWQQQKENLKRIEKYQPKKQAEAWEAIKSIEGKMNSQESLDRMLKEQQQKDEEERQRKLQMTAPQRLRAEVEQAQNYRSNEISNNMQYAASEGLQAFQEAGQSAMQKMGEFFKPKNPLQMVKKEEKKEEDDAELNNHKTTHAEISKWLKEIDEEQHAENDQPRKDAIKEWRQNKLFDQSHMGKSMKAFEELGQKMNQNQVLEQIESSKLAQVSDPFKFF